MTSEETQSRLAQLGDVLLKQTQNGTIEWRATDDEEAFLYSGTRGSIIVRRLWNEHTERHYCVLAVLNTRGTEVETLVERMVRNEANVYVAAEHNETLVALWHDARRSALKIDQVVEGLLEEIKDPKKFARGGTFNDEPPF